MWFGGHSMSADGVTPAQIGGRLPAFTGQSWDVALLLTVLGSSVLLLTVAVFVSGPLFAVTTIVTVAEAPLARVPRSQETVEVPRHLPSLQARRDERDPGRQGSFSATAVAASGPRFATVNV